MAEDLNETHLKRLIDTNEKTCLFLIQILSHQKSAKGGKKKTGTKVMRGTPAGDLVYTNFFISTEYCI